MKLTELNSPAKAGLIPYIEEDGEILMLFMVTSDAHYGGPDPMISKGHVDAGENTEQAAIREAEEELGLKQSNMVGKPALGWSGTLKGMEATYPFEVYSVRVKDKNDFGKFHYETASTHWLTMQQFFDQGRRSQIEIVTKVHASIKK